MPVRRFPCLLAVALAPLMTTAAAPGDPYIWLEQVHGERPDAWVAAENKRSLAVLESDPRYPGFRDDALRILEATDRVPMPNQLGDRITNLWQDATNVQGLWRETTAADYLKPTPTWTTLLDLDKLSAAEGVKWVWHGANCEPVDEQRCLVNLSAGGEDAVTVREYDLNSRRFVPDGFTLSTAKQEIGWETPDRLLIAREWGSGTLTKSGYPFVVKRLQRGAPLSSAVEIYRGQADDQVGVYPIPLVDGDGHRLTLLQRGRTFFESDLVVVGETSVKPLALPAKLQLAGLVDDRLVVVSDQDWMAPDGTPVHAGSLIAFDAAALREGRVPAPDILFVPSPRQSIDSVSVTAHHVIAPIYDNVRGQAWSFAHTGTGWTKSRLALPDNATVKVVSTDRHSDVAFLSVETFLTPLTLWQADLASGALRQAKANPPRFDASGFITEQHEATSRDGTKVPYFITHRRDAKLDGSTPTLMTAYGGFQVSSTPAYLDVRGKLWLEHGGAFVLANIRGGGEFGPAWHEAGLNTKRQVIYDDFAAVGEDLIRRKLTSPRRLGIYGGSNGGLLMGVEMTQRPDLWHAVAIEIPLLDMLRYEQLSAGSSWVGEYGSVSDPAVRAFWEKTSPYQALRRDGHYPEPFIWTTTKDDRVGPVQARKFAARMKEYGLPYLFWENTEGGHAAGANLQQRAQTQALETTYFTRKLMD